MYLLGTTLTNTPLEKLTSEISKQENELKILEIEYKNVVLGQGKNSSEAKDLNGDIKENKDKLNETEKATDELGDEMDDISKKTNLFGEVLKANLASDLIQNGIKKIIDGFKKLKDSIVYYVNTEIELSNMDTRLEDAESIEALISNQEKLGVVSKTVQLGW